MPVRTGSINATGVVDDSYFGATSDFNYSLAPNAAGTWTVKLERRFSDSESVATNEGDRLLTEGGDLILLESGFALLGDSSSSLTAEGGFRVCAIFTNATTIPEGIIECVGPTEYRLNCTDLTSGGPIEFRLG